jgi:hypothetical protein
MDQLRKAWGWLQRHHFWVLILVVVFVALGCWWSGASALLAEYKSNRSTIEAQFTAAGTVQSKPFHPNQAVQDGQAEQNTIQQQSVAALWKQLYDRQTAEVLKWPANLSKDFREHIQKLKFGDEIARNLRAQYNNYILDHFPTLPKIVGALEVPDGAGGGMGMGMGGGRGMGGGIDVRNLIEQQRNAQQGRGGEGGVGGEMPEEQDYIVIWADQQMVRDALYPSKTPTSKQIWKTQEDLWVYEALLRIIANTNKDAGADRFSNAAVRVIETLEVGKTAALASKGKGRIDMVVTAPAAGMEGMGMEGGGMEGGGMGPGMGMEGGMEGGMMGRGEFMGEGGMMGGATDPSLLDAELFNNRYVDAAGAPIAGEDFGKEFKRLPVRMRLWMDQRWLPNLITECANAPLQVEVTEVRVNPSENGAMGGGMPGMGGRGGEFGGGGGAVAGQDMAPEPDPQMKSIVIQGIIYIFNPPSTGEAAAAADPGMSASIQ